LVGAVRDIFGQPVRINGKSFDHQKEVSDALRGLSKQISTLRRNLDEDKFSGEALEEANRLFLELSKYKDTVTDQLNRAKKASGM